MKHETLSPVAQPSDGNVEVTDELLAAFGLDDETLACQSASDDPTARFDAS